MNFRYTSLAKKVERLQRWNWAIWGARTRVLVSHFLLIIFSTVLSIVIIRHILLVNLQLEIDQSLIQEVEEFRRLVKGKNPNTGEPFGEDVAAIFDVFLTRNVPHEDELLITLLNGKFYRASHAALPPSIQPDSDWVNAWATLTQPERGETVIQAGPLHYLAEPVRIGGRPHGVFVVARLPVKDYEEVYQAVAIVSVVEGIMAAIALTSSLAWLAAGQIIRRLRLLTETARSISESDLAQRIPVQGKDEIAELTITFNEMLERLSAAFASQRDFINDASHELRTPLTIIRCYLEQLNVDSQEQQKALGIVWDELNRMNGLVNDLLLLTKVEHPNFLNLEIVEVSSFTQELYTKAQALADRNWRLESKGSGRLIADRQRLTQAVINLAQNAAQHSTQDDVIALGSTWREGNFCVWVRDTGEGIAIADQKRIFKRFTRGSSRYYSEGAGLGLAIVEAIAQAHGGRVELISQPGAGATFTLIIPLEPTERDTV